MYSNNLKDTCRICPDNSWCAAHLLFLGGTLEASFDQEVGAGIQHVHLQIRPQLSQKPFNHSTGGFVAEAGAADIATSENHRRKEMKRGLAFLLGLLFLNIASLCFIRIK